LSFDTPSFPGVRNVKQNNIESEAAPKARDYGNFASQSNFILLGRRLLRPCNDYGNRNVGDFPIAMRFFALSLPHRGHSAACRRRRAQQAAPLRFLTQKSYNP